MCEMQEISGIGNDQHRKSSRLAADLSSSVWVVVLLRRNWNAKPRGCCRFCVHTFGTYGKRGELDSCDRESVEGTYYEFK